MYSFPNFQPVCHSMLVLTVASWPAYRFLRRQIGLSGIPISFRIFHILLWSTVKGVGIVSEAEGDVFLEFHCFLYDANLDVGNLMLKLKPDSAKKKKKDCTRVSYGIGGEGGCSGARAGQPQPCPMTVLGGRTSAAAASTPPTPWATLTARGTRLPMQGTSVQQMDSKSPRASGQLSPLTTTTEPTCGNYWSLAPGAGALQQEKPSQWEAHAPPRRAAPALSN